MAEFRGIDQAKQLFNLSKQSNGLMTMISQQQYAASKQQEKQKKQYKKNPSQIDDLNSKKEQNNAFSLNEPIINQNESLKHVNPTQLDTWEKQRLQGVINRQQKELAEHQQLQKHQPKGMIIIHSKVNDPQEQLNILTEKDSNQTNEDNQSQVSQQVLLGVPKGQFKRQKSQNSCSDTSNTRFNERNYPTDIKNEDFDSLQQNTKASDIIIPLPPKGNQIIEFTNLGYGNHSSLISNNSSEKTKVDSILSSQLSSIVSPQFDKDLLSNQILEAFTLERPENGMVQDKDFMTPKEDPHLMDNFNNFCNLLSDSLDDENDIDFLKQLMELQMKTNQEESNNNTNEFNNQQVKPAIIDADMPWNHSQFHSQATTQISLNFSGTPLSSPQPHTPLSFRSPHVFKKDNNSQYYVCNSSKTNYQYLSS